MISLRILSYAYVLLGLYAVSLAPLTSLSLGELLPAIIQLVACGALFAFGYSLHQGDPERASLTNVGARRYWPAAACFTLGPGVLVASVLTTRHYTAMTPSAVLDHLMSNQSLYSEYQSYNQELVSSGGAGGLTIWFALVIFRNALTLAVIFSVISRGGRILPREILLLLLVVAAQAYSGTARGTGLEFFQVGSALIFALMCRPKAQRTRSVRNFLPFAIGLALATLYVYILTARGSGSASLNLGTDVHPEESWLNALLGEGTVRAALNFYSYFGFGSHYVATYWSDLWLASPQNFLLGFLPGGYSAGNIDVRSEMANLVDIGPRWHPDSILLISNMGMIGLLGACVLLGRIAAALDGRAGLSGTILKYFIFLQMLAFPVGNFVWVDRSTFIIFLWLAILGLARKWGLITPSFRRFFLLRPTREPRKHGRPISTNAKFGQGPHGAEP